MTTKEITNNQNPKNRYTEFNRVPADVNRGIDNHRRAAQHYELAAKYHREAARQHEIGEHDKAALCTLIANGHQTLAS